MNKNKYIFNKEKGYCKLYYKDKYCLIDLDDVQSIMTYNWRYSKGYFATDFKKDNKRTTLSLHRYLMKNNLNNYNKNVIDHINRNKLDNRKCNLRICTQADNVKNRTISNKNKYDVIGITYINNKYYAFLSVDGKYINLGYFDKKEDAITERLKAEVVYFKEYSPQKHLFNEYNIDINKEYNVHNYIGRKQGNDKSIKGIHKYKYKTKDGYKNKWRVEFSINNIKYYLGLFDDLEEAIDVKENWYKHNIS